MNGQHQGLQIDGDARVHLGKTRVQTLASDDSGELRAGITDGLVSLVNEFYGCGPTHAESYYDDDLVVCVLQGGFGRVEQALLDGGRPVFYGGDHGAY